MASTPPSSPPPPSPPQHAANQHTCVNKRVRAGRGISKLSNVVWTITKFELSGAPLLPPKAAAQFRSTCGIVARTRVPITVESWKSVTEQEKQQLWEEVRRSFVFPSDSVDAVRRNALLRMDIAWKTFKTSLVNKFIKEEKEPFQKYPFLTQETWDKFVRMKTTDQFKESSAAHKAISKKNSHPHRLGTGGYAGKILEWEQAGLATQSDGTSMPLNGLHNPRAKHWYLARVKITPKGEATFKSAETEEVCKTLVELDRQALQGSFQEKREHDILSKALGNKEHPGRTRGVGVYVPWKHGFPNDPDYRRKKSRADFEDAIVERTHAQWEPRMIELEAMLMDRQKAMFTLEARDATQTQHQSSCGSAATPDEINTQYLVDDIKELTPCKLYVRFGGTILIEAGKGVAYPCLPGMTVHGAHLVSGFAKVQVDLILENMMTVPLVKPPNDDIITLRDAINSFVQWPKKDIVLDNRIEHSAEALAPASPLELEQPTSIMPSKSEVAPHAKSKTSQPEVCAVSLPVKSAFGRKGKRTKKTAKSQKLQISTKKSMPLWSAPKWKFKLGHPMVNDTMLVAAEAEKEASTKVPTAVSSPSSGFN